MTEPGTVQWRAMQKADQTMPVMPLREESVMFQNACMPQVNGDGCASLLAGADPDVMSQTVHDRSGQIQAQSRGGSPAAAIEPVTLLSRSVPGPAAESPDRHPGW